MITTGHMTVGGVGAACITATTRARVEVVLAEELDFPAVAEPTLGNVAPAELAGRLNSLLLTAAWADAIKQYSWADEDLGRCYSALHFLDTDVVVGSRPDRATLEKEVRATVAETDLNVVKGIESAVKTLATVGVESSTSHAAEISIALRVLAHLLGDIVQPYHATNPTYRDGGRPIATAGGNGIGIAHGAELRPVWFPLYAGDGGQGGEGPAPEFHLFWDACCAAFEQVPEPYNASFEPFGVAKWFGTADLGGGFRDHYVGHIDAIVARLCAEHSRLDAHPSGNAESAVAWATDSAVLAAEFLDPATMDLGVAAEGDGINVVFRDLDAYRRGARSTVERQLFLGGHRLGGLLDAIFDRSAAPTGFGEMVDAIAAADTPTLAELIAGAEREQLRHPHRRCAPELV